MQCLSVRSSLAAHRWPKQCTGAVVEAAIGSNPTFAPHGGPQQALSSDGLAPQCHAVRHDLDQSEADPFSQMEDVEDVQVDSEMQPMPSPGDDALLVGDEVAVAGSLHV